MATAEGTSIHGSSKLNEARDQISEAIKAGGRTVDELRAHIEGLVHTAVSQSKKPERARAQVLHPDKYSSLDAGGKKLLEDLIKNPANHNKQKKPSEPKNTGTKSGEWTNANTEKPWEQYGKAQTNDVPPWQTNPNKAPKSNEPPPWEPKGESKSSSGSTDDDLPWKKSAPKRPKPEVRRGYEFKSYTYAPVEASEKETQKIKENIIELFGNETFEVLQKSNPWKNLLSNFSVLFRGRVDDTAGIIHRTLKLVNTYESDIKNYLFQSGAWREFLSTPDNSNLEWKIKRVLEAINRVAELLKKLTTEKQGDITNSREWEDFIKDPDYENYKIAILHRLRKAN